MSCLFEWKCDGLVFKYAVSFDCIWSWHRALIAFGAPTRSLWNICIKSFPLYDFHSYPICDPKCSVTIRECNHFQERGECAVEFSRSMLTARLWLSSAKSNSLKSNHFHSQPIISIHTAYKHWSFTKKIKGQEWCYLWLKSWPIWAYCL